MTSNSRNSLFVLETLLVQEGLCLEPKKGSHQSSAPCMYIYCTYSTGMYEPIYISIIQSRCEKSSPNPVHGECLDGNVVPVRWYGTLGRTCGHGTGVGTSCQHGGRHVGTVVGTWSARGVH